LPLPTDRKVAALESARERAYQHLREWIIDGPLEAGEVVRDTQIAELLGVSRTPIREALIRLAQEGLVDLAHGRTRVAQLHHDRAPQLYRVGAELDGLASELAATRVTEGQLTQMEDILRRMAIETDPSKLSRLDEEFHAVYYLAADNGVLAEHLEQINVELRRFERLAFKRTRFRAEAHTEHLAILEALKKQDSDLARKLALENWMKSWHRTEFTRR
jgi:DNA-binding GntR family transcriptional regulator